MSGNIGSPSPIQPLSVGNVVSAGIRLYRSHLKDYFLLALKAYVWILVPIYGWGKCYALIALISRLAFGELVNQPESISSGERFVNSRMWQFLLMTLLMGFLGLGIVLGMAIVFGLFGFLSAVLIGGSGQQANPASVILLVAIAVIAGIGIFLGVFWFLTRFFLVDVPLAIEENIDATSSISRSWELTEGYVWRIVLISFITFLITIPIQILVQIITSILQVAFFAISGEDSGLFALLYFVLVLALSFTSGAAIVPLWQAIKAVVYYDLRSRREGLGLQLRDREI
ncbi:DUF975 domain-containing protein [Nostoc sp. FACHB-87]|uniref:DUF975 domain-containing protein n=1 Tax=Nostocaceae TaxID=1162 RepID=UPI00168A197D|nr:MULTISPECIES: DUF975 domain-containing protein [Nostocaceae]MBD2457164.1 DUF975 domain-containing protein [Nostoc sp. FACHB-87]MBD2476970.1 DUF975 domain-containing protein [Anabaena sp. FACHB-83]